MAQVYSTSPLYPIPMKLHFVLESADEYKSRLRAELDELNHELIEYFNMVIDKGTFSKVLDYEFHIDSIDRGRPIICHTELSPFETRKGIISEEIFRGERFDGLDDLLWNITTETFFDWFLDCWIKAGGEYYKGNAYIAVHDDITSLDLKTGEWIKDELRVDR